MFSLKHLPHFAVLFLGVCLIVAGSFFIAAGREAKSEVKTELVAERLVTAKDATIPNVPVDNAAAARAQADIIKQHTLKSTEGKTYSELAKDDPKRDLYIKSVALRTALTQAYMGFKVADLVMAVGALTVVNGIAMLMVSGLLLQTKCKH